MKTLCYRMVGNNKKHNIHILLSLLLLARIINFNKALNVAVCEHDYTFTSSDRNYLFEHNEPIKLLTETPQINLIAIGNDFHIIENPPYVPSALIPTKAFLTQQHTKFKMSVINLSLIIS